MWLTSTQLELLARWGIHQIWQRVTVNTLTLTSTPWCLTDSSRWRLTMVQPRIISTYGRNSIFFFNFIFKNPKFEDLLLIALMFIINFNWCSLKLLLLCLIFAVAWKRKLELLCSCRSHSIYNFSKRINYVILFKINYGYKWKDSLWWMIKNRNILYSQESAAFAGTFSTSTQSVYTVWFSFFSLISEKYFGKIIHSHT